MEIAKKRAKARAAGRTTAKERYEAAADEVEELLVRLGGALNDHEAKAGDDPDWGHVADLNHAIHELRQVLHFLGE
jgi:hypothetical protein